MTTYYHGGIPGLLPGQFILPPAETKQASLSDYGAGGIHRRDRVYVTTDPQAAALYAAMHPSKKGVVYQVEPQGELEPDPDCREPGLSFQCDRARIVSRTKLKGKLAAKIRKMMTGRG